MKVSVGVKISVAVKISIVRKLSGIRRALGDQKSSEGKQQKLSRNHYCPGDRDDYSVNGAVESG